MKRLLPILLSFVMCVQMNAQSQSCLAVIDELNKKNIVWTAQESIDYILAHKDAFDMDDEDSVDRWLYNLYLGTKYYISQRYQEAITCLRDVTRFYDSCGDLLDLSSNHEFLHIYYWEADCELNVGASIDIVLAKLKRAKSAYEKYSATETDIYNQILANIQAFESGNIELFKDLPFAIEHYMSKRYDKAIVLIERTISRLQDTQPVEDLYPLFKILGHCFLELERIKDAEQLYFDLLSRLKQQNKEECWAYRSVHDDLGVLYAQVHNYQKAKDYSGHSKWLHERYMDFGHSYTMCLSNCALAELGLGNVFNAKLFIDVALKYVRKDIIFFSSDELDTSMQFISSLNGASWDAFAFTGLAETNKYRPYMTILSNASVINQKTGFWDEAVVCMKECISLGKIIGEESAFSYNNMGMLYANQSKFSESLPYLSKAAALCNTDYEKNDIWHNYALVLWLSHFSECTEVAIQTSHSITNSITNYFAFLSQEEKFNYYKHFEFDFQMLNLILFEHGNPNLYGQIYDNILTTKGLLLRTSNNIKHAIMKSNDQDLMDKYNRMISLRQQAFVDRDSTARRSITKEYELLDKQISRSIAAYGIFTNSNNIKWHDVLDRLKDRDIAIEFCDMPIVHHTDTIENLDTESRYCAVLLKKGYANPKIIPLCRKSELTDMDLDQLYSSDRLYRLIWKPLEQELKGVKNLYFAADGELHNIGIEYAQLPHGEIMNDCYNMFRLSSTRVLAEERKDVKALNAVLYGGLRYDLDANQLIAESRNGAYHSESTSRGADLLNMRYGVKYLPGTKEEVEDIYKSFALNTKARCRMITDMAGTEESFKSLAFEDVGIIHLATHGFYWNEEEAKERDYVSFLQDHQNNSEHVEDRALQRSGLFFSGANIGLAGEELPDDVEDGVLTAHELSVMNLGNVDMVVMSACQSGLGETSGEGVFGLQRGFKLAGANTLLMSLWKVDDEATKMLMTEFYRNYLSGKSKRESLMLAQRKLRQTHPEPEYWAGFILLDALN